MAKKSGARKYKKDHFYGEIYCPVCKKTWARTVKEGSIMSCKFCNEEIKIPHYLKLVDKEVIIKSGIPETFMLSKCIHCNEIYRIRIMWSNHTAICPVCEGLFEIERFVETSEQKPTEDNKVLKQRKKAKHWKG